VDQERNSSSAVVGPRCINCFILLSRESAAKQVLALTETSQPALNSAPQ
jgi:hypothetical protein